MTTNPMDFGRSALKIDQRSIVLIDFPFSDLSASKVRPALVVSNDNYNAQSLDAVALAISSNIAHSLYKVFIGADDLVEGTLPITSAIRVDKPFSILQTKVLKVQAKVSIQKFEEVKRVFVGIFSAVYSAGDK
jgi:mRNA interferase MazF